MNYALKFESSTPSSWWCHLNFVKVIFWKHLSLSTTKWSMFPELHCHPSHLSQNSLCQEENCRRPEQWMRFFEMKLNSLKQFWWTGGNERDKKMGVLTIPRLRVFFSTYLNYTCMTLSNLNSPFSLSSKNEENEE